MAGFLNPGTKQMISVGLCGLAMLFAIIAMATRGWVTMTYNGESYAVGLQSGLPTVYLDGMYDRDKPNENIDEFRTEEFKRVGTMALGFGLLGLFLVSGGFVISGCKARGKEYSETYFGTLASCLMAALAFFFGSILYSLSIPNIASGQAPGFSLGLFVVAGCFATFAGCLSF